MHHPPPPPPRISPPPADPALALCGSAAGLLRHGRGHAAPGIRRRLAASRFRGYSAVRVPMETSPETFLWTSEIAIPVHPTIKVVYSAHPTADVFINFASFRSVAMSSMSALMWPTIRVVAIIVIIGPATIGGIQAGAFKIEMLSRREKATNFKPDYDIDIHMKVLAMSVQESSILTGYKMKVRTIKVEKRINEIVNRLNKTKVERKPDLKAEREAISAAEKAERKAQLRDKKRREEMERLDKEKQADIRSYKGLMVQEKMTSNKQIASGSKTLQELEEDFM
ncbi:hypothetical protein ZEAMMB73_Zm00001d033426 [Zea mays]|uniref:Coiled-coil domain-containing protein 25 n=1 Tax=Zea mays TaxID=4577 RepID=A0A1D6KYY1_MAIZE|nr:hypothetical protein ZEAMMB73_Zm00001d033426 [Zea mays]